MLAYSMRYAILESQRGAMNVEYILIVLGAYVLGSSSMALYLSLIFKKDFRKNGSGNLGASNAMLLMGWKAGILVGIHDIGKGILAVLLAQWIFPDVTYAGAAAGAACILGHIFPFYLKFKGGKGLAAYIGVLAGLDIRVALAASAILIIVTLLTDYIVVGTMTTITTGPLALLFHEDWVVAVIMVSVSVVITVKHFENFRRIRNHTEPGLRSGSKGKYRV